MTSANRQKKEKEVAKLVETLGGAKSFALVNYAGMGVKKQQELKKALREVGGKMIVAKNTLFKIAAEKSKNPKEVASDEVLVGQTALIVGEDDPVAPIQVLGKFAKENEMPELRVGVVEGVFADTDGLIRISKLPGKEVLLGQVVGGVAAPIHGLLGTMNANMQKLVFVLKQASESGGDN